MEDHKGVQLKEPWNAEVISFSYRAASTERLGYSYWVTSIGAWMFTERGVCCTGTMATSTITWLAILVSFLSSAICESAPSPSMDAPMPAPTLAPANGYGLVYDSTPAAEGGAVASIPGATPSSAATGNVSSGNPQPIPVNAISPFNASGGAVAPISDAAIAPVTAQPVTPTSTNGTTGLGRYGTRGLLYIASPNLKSTIVWFISHLLPMLLMCEGWLGNRWSPPIQVKEPPTSQHWMLQILINFAQLRMQQSWGHSCRLEPRENDACVMRFTGVSLLQLAAPGRRVPLVTAVAQETSAVRVVTRGAVRPVDKTSVAHFLVPQALAAAARRVLLVTAAAQEISVAPLPTRGVVRPADKTSVAQFLDPQTHALQTRTMVFAEEAAAVRNLTLSAA